MTERAIATSTTTVAEWRGPVLDVLRQMLGDHERSQQVLAIFEQLVARNSELELQLSELMSRRNKGEGVSAAQLLLFLDRLQSSSTAGDAEPASNPCTSDLDEAGSRLRAASGIDAQCNNAEKAAKPPAQPSVRKPFPDHLRREPQVIPVPEAERACPVCGSERKCIGHDVTEVAELKPAEVFVRVEMREKLWCEPCEGEIVRAPVGDRVVSGGRFGSTLAAQLLVDKYEDGLPLHRQQQRFERMGLPVSVSTLADQVTWVTDLLAPLWRAAQEAVLAAEVMHVDGTGMPVLVRDPKTHKKIGTGKRLGTMWGYLAATRQGWSERSLNNAVSQTKFGIAVQPVKVRTVQSVAARDGSEPCDGGGNVVGDA